MATKLASTVTQHHTAMPAHVTPPEPMPTALSKRGHIRSASLENANSFISKNTNGLPTVSAGHSGTLKSRNEQKRMRSKFGSHTNLDDYVQQGRTKFQNLRQMFELSKRGGGDKAAKKVDKESQMWQSMPPSVAASVLGPSSSSSSASPAAIAPPSTSAATHTNPKQPSMQSQPGSTQQQMQAAYRQQYAATAAAAAVAHQHLPRKPTPTLAGTPNGCGNRNSISEIIDQQQQQQNFDNNNRTSHHQQAQMQHRQTHGHGHQPPRPQQQRQTMPGPSTQTVQPQQPPPQPQMQPPSQRSASGLAHLQHDVVESSDQQAASLLRPIAFKPIPFEPDYSIPNNRYSDVAVGDRYGSTPSLAPMQGSNMRFGSTTDLRHGNAGGFIGVGGGVGCGGGGGGYSSNNYCNSLMARRRGSRSLKINDSMESIRHTPTDPEGISPGSQTIKSNCNIINARANAYHQNNNSNSNNNGNNSGNGHSLTHSHSHSHNHNHNHGSSGHKSEMLSGDQCDMTPSPSDSGVSDLEAALKDRDSELSYLRQTMEHNEKDKETYWENETKRLKTFYEGQQREHMLKLKKMEQMLAMQQFQFKQHKMRHNDQTNKLREQVGDLKNENEILKSNNIALKNSERNLKDRVAYIEEQLRETSNSLIALRAELEESEWKVCERNGEIALLKTQLKEANVEITMKEHAIVHLRHENTNAETQIYQSLQEHQKIAQHQKEFEQQKEQSQRATETELRQLNKIVILKDQVILALTSELAKLRKELSDLAISHEYGEEPSGKYTRLKQKLDNLSDICSKTQQHIQKVAGRSENADTVLPVRVVDDANLEVIMNCLKIAPPLDDSDNDDERKLSADQRLAKMSADIQKFVYGSQNLPDIAVNTTMPLRKFNNDIKNNNKNNNSNNSNNNNNNKIEEATIDTLIEESAGYAEEIGKLRQQLDNVRVNFELEKRQWCEEKEKVLRYQKQLQTHYINMYQKLRNIENSSEVV